MRADKLRNLLDTLLKRVVATESSFQNGIGDDAPTTVAKLSTLKATLRRHLSKPDALRIASVIDLEAQIEALRSAARKDLSDVHPSEPLARLLHNIAEDESSLRNLTSGMRIGLNQLQPDDVLEAMPAQKTAAFKFQFLDGRLTVVDEPLTPRASEASIAEAALEAAVDQGQFVSDDLASSNTSPRLKEAFSRLLQAMIDRKGVVQIGMRATACSKMIAAASDELSAIQAGLLVAHIDGVFSALAQFEEWRLFNEQSAAANVDAASVKILAENARNLGRQLKQSDSVDQAVSDALSTVSDWATEDIKPDPRDTLSLARTIENCWLAICREALLVRQEVAAQARKVVAAGIVAIALGTALLSVPIIGKLPGGQWIEFAVSYFKANQPPLTK